MFPECYPSQTACLALAFLELINLSNRLGKFPICLACNFVNIHEIHLQISITKCVLKFYHDYTYNIYIYIKYLYIWKYKIATNNKYKFIWNKWKKKKNIWIVINEILNFSLSNRYLYNNNTIRKMNQWWWLFLRFINFDSIFFTLNNSFNTN